MSRVKLMDTGRYCEAAIARGEAIEDVEIMHTLRINNVFDATYVFLLDFELLNTYFFFWL